MCAFYLVLINMFLSIIVASFNKQLAYIKQMQLEHGDQDALKKFAQRCVKWFWGKLAFLDRLKLIAALNAGSSGKKLNFELINKLKAQKRAQSKK